MSTRAIVIIKDESSEMILYRHSDGYPKGTGAELVRFIQGYHSGAMRDNVGQSAGWLIIQGHAEYLDGKPFTGKADASDRGYGWKAGSFEPCGQFGMGEEYVYVIDLDRKTLSCRVPNAKYWGSPSLKNTTACKEFPTVSFAKIEVVA